MIYPEGVPLDPLGREGAAAASPMPPTQGAPGPPDGGGRRAVLVVDDESILRQVLVETIGDRYGCKIFEAEDGLEAVEAFQAHQDEIGLVLMDCMMPRLRGPDAFDEIRRIQPGVLGILMSGFSDEIGQEFVQRHGFAALLKKPFPFRVLADLMADLGIGAGKAQCPEEPEPGSPGPGDP